MRDTCTLVFCVIGRCFKSLRVMYSASDQLDLRGEGWRQ